jgi:NADH:ubiquinone oxidoreductase subunit 3 (subunit A)
MEGNAKQEAPVPKRHLSWAIARLLIAVLVVLLAAWFVSNITAGSVDFWRALIVLLLLAVAEWYLRAWQTRLQE